MAAVTPSTTGFERVTLVERVGKKIRFRVYKFMALRTWAGFS
jgi:hypothetical protein